MAQIQVQSKQSPFSEEYLAAVAQGNVPGASLVHKFGRNSAVSTTLVPVCNGGIYQTPTGTATLAAVSNDTNDTAAGTGAQEVTHKTGESYPEMTDIGFMATATSSSDISVEFKLLLLDN